MFAAFGRDLPLQLWYIKGEASPFASFPTEMWTHLRWGWEPCKELTLTVEVAAAITILGVMPLASCHWVCIIPCENVNILRVKPATLWRIALHHRSITGKDSQLAFTVTSGGFCQYLNPQSSQPKPSSFSTHGHHFDQGWASYLYILPLYLTLHPTYSLLLCHARGFIPQAKSSSISTYGLRFD